MSETLGIERCLSFIHCQLSPPDSTKAAPESPVAKRAVTLSRQSGCGAHEVAEKLANFLQGRAKPGTSPWTIYDRNLVERVLEDHQLPPRLARFMPEDRVRGIDDITDELFGLHPPSWTLVQQTSETILRLAEAGNVILVGRGANLVCAGLPHMLHVRLTGSLEHRIQRKQRLLGLDRREAVNLIRREDVGRQRYLRRHFGRDIDDPLLYHLVINTDWILPDAAARLIGELVLQPVQVSA